MKKLSVRVALFFSLIGMLFTSCLGFWEEVLHGIACPINSIILYDHDRGITSDVDEYNPIEFNVGDTYEVWYDIEYSASTNQATFILKSDDTSVAIPLESEKKTTTTSGYFTIKAVG